LISVEVKRYEFYAGFSKIGFEGVDWTELAQDRASGGTEKWSEKIQNCGLD
jgi:hypothetical protein